MSNRGKWFTCTPVRFPGDLTFFTRDSGLLCKGFQEIGVDCKAIMPGPAMADDQVCDLIRTDYSNLENPSWWAALQPDGVVLYSWADPKYEKVAAAIREAGINLIINTDTAGVLSIWTDGSLYLSYRRSYLRYEHGKLKGFIYFIVAALRSLFPWAVDYPRLRHMRHANFIGAVTPSARSKIEHYASTFGYPDVATKIRVIHHPVSTYTSYQGQAKENIIVALGRWTRSDLVKRPKLLLEIIGAFLKRNAFYRFEIIGPYDDILDQGIAAMPTELRSRVTLRGRISNEQVAQALVRSKISLCTSSSESFHIASAEAVCAGCTAVGLSSPLIAFLQYLASNDCAALAESDEVSSYLDALIRETSAWDNNERSPLEISRKWSARLHAPCVATEILHLSSSPSHLETTL